MTAPAPALVDTDAGSSTSAPALTETFAEAHPGILRALQAILAAVLVGTGATAATLASNVPTPTPTPSPAPVEVTPAAEDAASACDPLLLRLVLHQSAKGQAFAALLEAEGRHELAEAARAWTSAAQLPNDLQLCVLLEQQRRGQP